MTHEEAVRHAEHMVMVAGEGLSVSGATEGLWRLKGLAERRAAEWARANNDREYSESKAHMRKWWRMESRRVDLEWELRFFYGAKVTWPGLYPTVECPDGYAIYF